MASRFPTDCEGFHRRDFLKIGAAGLFGLTLPQLLRLESQAQAAEADGRPKRRANAVIMLWLAGGPATIDMWDLKPERPDRASAASSSRSPPAPTACRSASTCRRRPRSATSVTIVRSLNHTIPSHGPATVFMTTGNKPTPALQYPVLGSLTTRLLPPQQGVPPYVTFGEIAQRHRGRLPRHRLQPVHHRGRRRQGRARAARRTSASAASSCRPASRSTSWKTATSCFNDFDEHLPRRRQGRRPGRRPRRLPQAGAGDPALRQDEEGVRPGAGEAGAARRLRRERASARARWRPGGWSRRACAS